VTTDQEIGQRELCPDGACTGVLDEDGRCPICGLDGRAAREAPNPFLDDGVQGEPGTRTKPARPPRSRLTRFLFSEQATSPREAARWIVLCILGLAAFWAVGLFLFHVVGPYLRTRENAALRDARSKEAAEAPSRAAQQAVEAWYSENCRTTHVDPKQRCFFCQDGSFANAPPPGLQRVAEHLGGADSIRHGVTFCKDVEKKWWE